MAGIIARLGRAVATVAARGTRITENATTELSPLQVPLQTRAPRPAPSGDAIADQVCA